MDDIGICNMALSAIAAQATVASFTENSTEAQTCNLHYATTRDELLRSHDWNFARQQITLAIVRARYGTPENPSNSAQSAQPPLPWNYEYAYPANCEKVQQILALTNTTATGGIPLTTGPTGIPSFTRAKFVRFIEAGDTDTLGNDIRVILTNQPQAVLVFTKRIINPNLWDPGFVTAMIGRLASKLVIPCSGDKSLAGMAIKAGQEIEDRATVEDGNAGVTVVDMTASWIDARTEGAGEGFFDGGLGE